MARSLPVKWFDDTVMAGAPELNATAGSLIAVLDACLIDGFNVKTVQNFVIAGGIGTITFPSSGHGYVLHQVAALAGATDDQYNGDWRVTEVNATNIKVDATGVANATVAGTLSCTTPPLGGWVKAFYGTNLAAYKSTVADSSGLYLRVYDPAGRAADVRGYEAMTDINTGAGLFPTIAQKSTYRASKSQDGVNLSRWTLVGDKQFFYLSQHDNQTNITSSPNSRDCLAFGDILSFRPNDAYHCLISSGYSQQAAIVSEGDYSYLARAHTQLGSALSVSITSSLGFGQISGSVSLPQRYPNGPDNSLILSDARYIVDGNYAATSIRGKLPGFFECLQGGVPSSGTIFADALGTGKHVMLIGASPIYRFALDITGPWR